MQVLVQILHCMYVPMHVHCMSIFLVCSEVRYVLKFFTLIGNKGGGLAYIIII